jgi:hypothetical protein
MVQAAKYGCYFTKCAAGKWVVTNVTITSVPGGATAALELAALYVRLLSVCPDAECECEYLHTHSYRSGSAPSGPQSLKVGTHKYLSSSLIIGIQK